MSLIWIVGGELESIGTNSLQALWMKARNAQGVASYSIPQINYYPSGATAVAIVSLLATAVWTDYTGKRHQVNVLIAACLLVSASMLLAYDSLSIGAFSFAFYLAGVSFSGQASNFAWANDICRNDDQERGIVLASMNSTSLSRYFSQRLLNLSFCPQCGPTHSTPGGRSYSSQRTMLLAGDEG